MISQQQVIDEARSWVGVRFLHQGRSRQGVDCIGLIIVIARDLGLVSEEFDSKNYGRAPGDGRLLMEVAEKCTQVSVVKPATLLVIRWNVDPFHVAICTGPTLIHSNSTVGKVVEHGYRHPWPKLTMSIWQLPEIEYE